MCFLGSIKHGCQMELFADRYLLLCWAVAGGSALLSATLAPWLMGRSMRSRGHSGGTTARRIAACFLMSAAIPIGLLLLFGSAHPVLLLPGLAGAVLLFVLVGESPRLFLWGRHLGIILLCNLVYLAAFWAGVGRCRQVGKRSIDGQSLHAIGIGLLMYREQDGVFPDDLRRLVDVKFISPFNLLPAFTHTPRKYPETRPYSGPCEFAYIRLPHDAPEGLVWVWESPEFQGGEGAWVLYAWGNVQWVTPEKLREDVEHAEAWLHATQRRPVSMPATTTSLSNQYYHRGMLPVSMAVISDRLIRTRLHPADGLLQVLHAGPGQVGREARCESVRSCSSLLRGRPA